MCPQYQPPEGIFTTAEQIRAARTIKKLNLLLRRIINLDKSIRNYDKYVARCNNCKINHRPIEALEKDREELIEQFDKISKVMAIISFSPFTAIKHINN